MSKDQFEELERRIASGVFRGITRFALCAVIGAVIVGPVLKGLLS